MFVRIVQGTTSQPHAVQAAIQRWLQDMTPGVAGLLSITAGITEDNRCVAVLHFESEQLLSRYVESPEPVRWWIETEQLLDHGATVRNSTEIIVDGYDRFGRAGFVRIVQGRGTGPARGTPSGGDHARAGTRTQELGRITIGHDDGTWTVVAYFASEGDTSDHIETQPQESSGGAPQPAADVTAWFDLRNPLIQAWAVALPAAGWS